MRPSIVLAAVIIVASASVAQAQPLATTKYRYYSINGSTALEVYKSMLVHGPRVNGAEAYASTSAQPLHEALLVQGQSCRIRDFKFTINFVVQLPRMNNERKLSPLIRSKWQQFSRFIMKHEETHRAIWMACAREFESKVTELRSRDCKSVQTKAAQLWEDVTRVCDLKHQAFDAAQQKLIPKQPFVKLVLGTSSSAVATASIATKKRRKTTAAALANW
jgi:predicted secreted Zn-dependent protease